MDATQIIAFWKIIFGLGFILFRRPLARQAADWNERLGLGRPPAAKGEIYAIGVGVLTIAWAFLDLATSGVW